MELSHHDKSCSIKFGGCMKFDMIKGPGIMDAEEDFLRLLSFKDCTSELLMAELFPGDWSPKKCYFASQLRQYLLVAYPSLIKCNQCQAQIRPSIICQALLEEEDGWDDLLVFPRTKGVKMNEHRKTFNQKLRMSFCSIDNRRGPFSSSSAAKWLRNLPLVQKDFAELKVPAEKTLPSGEKVPLSAQEQKAAKVEMICKGLEGMLSKSVKLFNTEFENKNPGGGPPCKIN